MRSFMARHFRISFTLTNGSRSILTRCVGPGDVWCEMKHHARVLTSVGDFGYKDATDGYDLVDESGEKFGEIRLEQM